MHSKLLISEFKKSCFGPEDDKIHRNFPHPKFLLCKSGVFGPSHIVWEGSVPYYAAGFPNSRNKATQYGTDLSHAMWPALGISKTLPHSMGQTCPVLCGLVSEFCVCLSVSRRMWVWFFVGVCACVCVRVSVSGWVLTQIARFLPQVVSHDVCISVCVCVCVCVCVHVCICVGVHVNLCCRVTLMSKFRGFKFAVVAT